MEILLRNKSAYIAKVFLQVMGIDYDTAERGDSYYEDRYKGAGLYVANRWPSK